MILLYRGMCKLSRVIAFRTWFPETHAAQELDDGTIIEASWPTVRTAPDAHAGHTPKTPCDRYELKTPLTDGERDGLREFLRAQIGKPYDLAGIVRFLTREEKGDDRALFCSELICLGYEHIKRPLLERIPAWKVSPGLIAASPCLRLVSGFLTDPLRSKAVTHWAGRYQSSRFPGALGNAVDVLRAAAGLATMQARELMTMAGSPCERDFQEERSSVLSARAAQLERAARALDEDHGDGETA